MQIAANLDRLWADLPFPDRVETAAAAGVTAVAVAFPYEMPARETRLALLRAGVDLMQIMVPPPNYTGGDRGFAAVPDSAQRFRYDMRRALRYAHELRVSGLHVLGGVAEGDKARSTLVENLRAVATDLPGHITLTIGYEADPGAFLCSTEIAADVLREVAHPQIGLALDLPAGPSAAEIAVASYGDLVKTVSVPHDPGEEATALGAALRAAGYGGWIIAAWALSGQSAPDLTGLNALTAV
ncbi:TIM barrel protein [uncultured Roseobacter sp.]|uniref:TIM barrel protein n=1 Tax=uncultured Roseobacter sp. TaxID=114847 RepID=UPI00261B4040|nr:TIM barrel protein [uncultured Roseobacter sp.]